MEISEQKKKNSSLVTKFMTRRFNRSALFFFLPLFFLMTFFTFKAFAAKTPNKKSLQTSAWSVVREGLTSDDSAVREQAVQALEYINNDQVTNALLSSLKDESEWVQIWAARALIKKGNPAG